MHVALVHMRARAHGGTERYLNQMAGGLIERGHRVTVVCRSHEQPPAPGVEFAILRPLSVGGAARLWGFARAVERHVADAEYDLVFGLGKTWSHDVIRLGGGCHGTYLELAHAETLRPIERALGTWKRKHRLALAAEARALAPGAYRHVITNSHMVRRDVQERYAVPDEALTVVYNGVNLERFRRDAHREPAAALRRAQGAGAETPVVLFLGTGYGRKGLSLLLSAFKEQEHHKAQLWIVGRDGQAQAFEREAQSLGIAAHVRFLGGTLQAEHFYAAADLYALPTRYDPFANTTLEALASGLPVITSESNGGSELIEEQVSGSVVSVSSGHAPLSAALNYWLADRRFASARDAARTLAETRPESRVVAESIDVLEACVQGS